MPPSSPAAAAAAGTLHGLPFGWVERGVEGRDWWGWQGGTLKQTSLLLIKSSMRNICSTNGSGQMAQSQEQRALAMTKGIR